MGAPACGEAIYAMTMACLEGVATFVSNFAVPGGVLFFNLYKLGSTLLGLVKGVFDFIKSKFVSIDVLINQYYAKAPILKTRMRRTAAILAKAHIKDKLPPSTTGINFWYTKVV